MRLLRLVKLAGASFISLQAVHSFSTISRRLVMTSSDSSAAVSLPILRTPQDVHNFWFGESAKAGAGMDAMNDQVKFWFSSNFPEFNAVQQNNAALIDDVMNDNLDPAIWNSDEDPIALVAKVIILDQFTRSVHRGTARAFEGDLMAASLVKYAAGKGWYPLKFSAPERLFLCLNLYHTESPEHHELGRRLTEAFIEGVPEDTQKFLISIREGILNDHYLVIKQFGRYPHRNVLLGRESTVDEEAWLASPDLPAWAKSQLPTK